MSTEEGERAGTARRSTKSGGRTRGRARRTARESTTEFGDLERPRTGQKRTITETIAELPNYLRLLWGLMTDMRVARMDKFLVLGAIAYIMMPLDWIPDFIPFLGQVDDVFVLVMSLQRLVESAGRNVLLDHWPGEPEALDDLNMYKVLAAAAFFLPRRVRRRLRVIGRM